MILAAQTTDGPGGASSPPVSSEAFKDALAAVVGPVCVVTTTHEGRPHGTTVSAFCSQSLSPPLVLISLDRSSTLLQLIRKSGRFGVNVLGVGQDHLATRFAAKGCDKFRGIGWTADSELPRLSETACWLACDVHLMLAGGDHVAVIGLVLGAARAARSPLCYRERRFLTLVEDPPQTPAP
jgi:flavin reductase (DIM6/NTAB) family NADH-FMN oxidoreductase RutF